jgi:hypothetical protein
MSALIFDLKRLNNVDVPDELSWAIKRAVHREARRDRVISLLRPVPFLTSAAAAAIILVVAGFSGGGTDPVSEWDGTPVETFSAVDQNQLQRYILPPQISDLQGTGLFDNQLAPTDSSRSETPIRLPGARAVSF